MSNIDKFNTTAAYIFSILYDSFPVSTGIGSVDFCCVVLPEEPIGREADEWSEMLEHTMQWLHKENYINIGTDTNSFDYFNVTLTAKGLQLLSLPDSLTAKESMGQKMSTATKTGALEGLKELGKTAIIEGTKLGLQFAWHAMISKN